MRAAFVAEAEERHPDVTGEVGALPGAPRHPRRARLTRNDFIAAAKVDRI